jgi:small subunit ribosomal protein S20
MVLVWCILYLCDQHPEFQEVNQLANTKSALKAMRVAEKRRLRNRADRSRMRSIIRRAETTVAAGAGEESAEQVMQAISLIDRSASKGIIHPNQAARRKSRLMKKLNRVQASA